ncbi:phosphatidate cytidylyltransferase [Acutalibacter caecimuris]|uniref:phosphatidate cytidylyltransferase n=1 Tax=Acutalibacter caecimuris TaxID=3093657 RepID=UPI002AC9B280|nr:phosphatidate cytidylyltransferase [Acutalibacter sp. M00118]
MKQRVLSGVVLTLFAAAIVVFDQIFPLALNIAVALISAAAVEELARALELQRKWFLYMPSLAAAAVVPFCKDDFLFLAYAIYTLVLFAAMIVYHHETTFKEVGVLYSMVVLIPCALNSLVAVRELNRGHGMFYVLIAVLAAWVADMGAYFAGTLFGRHKLCPEISPKKTIEGAIGGTVADVAVMLLCGLWFSMGFYRGEVQVNYLALFLIGFFGSWISILGDLSFSLIKRSCHIKDFGQVIPGHGGILDRFDSVIFTAPFVYLLVSFLPLAGV